VCEVVLCVSIIMGSESSKWWMSRRGSLGGKPCPVTTGRDVQIIMETS